MSEKKNPEKTPSMDASFNPKREGPEKTEEQQVEKSIHSIDIENADLPDSLEALNLKNPTFDIALGQLALQIKDNPTSIPKRLKDQIAALKSTSDQMAELERASGSDAKAGLESAGDAKAVSGSAGDATDQMVASESPVQSSASWDPADFPKPPRINLIYNTVQEHFPSVFTEGNLMRDVYGVTTIRNEILLESHHKLLFLLYMHRLQHQDAGLETLLSEALIREIKYLYSLNLIENLVLEGDRSNFSQLVPAPGEELKLKCAALTLGLTLLAFAKHSVANRKRKFKQMEERCRTAGVPLPNEPQTEPLHPLTTWLQCISVSFNELKNYAHALLETVNNFYKIYLESTNRERNSSATK